MGFQDPNMSVSRSFQRRGGASNIRPRDRLAEVVGYDTARGVMLAKDVDSGRHMEVSIDPNRVRELTEKMRTRKVSEDAPKFVGHLINEDMAEHLKVGERVVLEGTVPDGKPTKRGDVEYMQIRARYINGVPDSSPNKAFRCIFTADAYEGRVASVQVWEDQALDATANADKIEELFAKMSEVRAAYEAEKHPVGLGMQMRAIVPKGTDKEGNTAWETIDTTPAFYWVAPERDAANNVTGGNHPMDADKAVELINGYLGYLDGKFPQGSLGQDEKGNEIDFRVEVMPFRNYKASIQSKRLVIYDNSPLHSITSTPTKCAQDDEEMEVGRNIGVNGIVVLSSDKQPLKRGEDWIARDLVNNIFTNGYRAHICSMVRSFDGALVRVHPALDRPRPANASSTRAPASASAPADSGFDDAGGFDAFDAGDDDTNAFSAVMNAETPAPAATPAAAAKAAPDKAPAKPAGRTTSFGSGPRRA